MAKPCYRIMMSAHERLCFYQIFPSKHQEVLKKFRDKKRLIYESCAFFPAQK